MNAVACFLLRFATMFGYDLALEFAHNNMYDIWHLVYYV